MRGIGGRLREDWRRIGGALDDWRRVGGGLEEDWRRIGGGRVDGFSIGIHVDRCSIDVR